MGNIINTTLKCTDHKRCSLRNNDLNDDNIEPLLQDLKTNSYTELDLSYNNIECRGLRRIADALVYTKIHTVSFESNKFRNEGVKYLADVLKDTQIKKLDLSGNKIGFEAALYLNNAVKNTRVKDLSIDVYCTENVHCICQKSVNNIDNTVIRIKNCNLGAEGSEYVNQSFCNTGIRELTFEFEKCTLSQVTHLAEAMKNINIDKLSLLCSHFAESEDIGCLFRIFANSQIGELNVSNTLLTPYQVHHIAKFIQRIKVYHLNLSSDELTCESVGLLAPSIENSYLMNLDLSINRIKANGAKILSDTLKRSMLLVVNLCHNKIGISGATFLSEGLPNSQVIGLYLIRTDIGFEGYRELISVINDTNLSWLNVRGVTLTEKSAESMFCCKINKNATEITLAKLQEAGMDGERMGPVPRITVSMANQIVHAFSKVVRLDCTTNKYNFIIPTSDQSSSDTSSTDIEQYAILISAIRKQPNSKAHIFRMVNELHEYAYDYEAMGKIDEFVDDITIRFILFFDNNVRQFMFTFDNFNLVDFVKQFEKLELFDIVEHLLLHRIMFYVDENQRILHPVIYKLLCKYELPVYNSLLETDKKREIIEYYESHPDLDSVEEVIQLLKTNSL